jgi:microcystin-dependent protein
MNLPTAVAGRRAGQVGLPATRENTMEGTLAEIRLFAGNFAPRGWAFCDGRTLPIAQRQALFALLGTMYGGDGQTSFCLPKLAPPADAPHDTMKYIICLDGVFPSRD